MEIYSTAPFTYSGGSGTHLNDAGGNYFELTFTTSAALPIELTSFKSLKKNGGVTQLLWSTSSEINNSHFEVERSANGSDWELLANVDGYGTTTTPRDYVFEDRTPLAGLNYYRLRQVDFDGTFTFSPVVVESMETLDASALQVWPVPAATTVNLRWNGAVETTVEVLDAQGRLLRTLRIAPNGQFELPVGEFSSSLLFLRTVNAQGEVSIRKVVLM